MAAKETSFSAIGSKCRGSSVDIGGDGYAGCSNLSWRSSDRLTANHGENASMRSRDFQGGLHATFCGVVLAAAVMATGCQVSTSGQTLPSATIRATTSSISRRARNSNWPARRRCSKPTTPTSRCRVDRVSRRNRVSRFREGEAPPGITQAHWGHRTASWASSGEEGASSRRRWKWNFPSRPS